MNVQQIEISLIDPPLFNSRLAENTGNDDELKALGDSLKERQLQPIAVVAIKEGTADRYRLVFGSRRLAAAKLVGLTSISADVQTGVSEADEAVSNGIENVRRRDLTTFEQARLCAKLRELKLTGPEVGNRLGLSKQHVSNLALCYEHLPAEVKKAWKDGAQGTDLNFLRSIITKEVDGKKVTSTPDEMKSAYWERLEALEEVTGEEEDEEEDGETDTDDGTETAGAPAAKKFTVYKERYKKLLKALRAVRASQMCIDACRYLVGDIEKIRGVPVGDDKAPTKKTDKTKGEK